MTTTLRECSRQPWKKTTPGRILFDLIFDFFPPFENTIDFKSRKSFPYCRMSLSSRPHVTDRNPPWGTLFPKVKERRTKETGYRKQYLKSESESDHPFVADESSAPVARSF